MDFTRRIETELSYDDAVAATKEALQSQGFGTLTEIDMRETLKAKLDVDVEAQVIIGACNPELALRAVQADARVATLLPCNVVVRRVGEQTVVEALDPGIMAEVTGNEDLAAVADEAAAGIQAALESVRDAGAGSRTAAEPE